MPKIPHDAKPDSSLVLLRDGYRFIEKGCQRHASDIFATRLLLQRTICLSGAEWAEVFSDNEKFRRQDASPARLKNTLLGQGGVQGVDGAAHRNRKRMFLAETDHHKAERLRSIFEKHWLARLAEWEHRGQIMLHDEMRSLLCAAATEWADVPVYQSDIDTMASELGELIESPGAIGWKYWRGRVARKRLDDWAAGVIRDARRDELHPPSRTRAAIANHRDLEGELLPERVAAVELLNVIRPIVAVARFITFVALALHTYAGSREKLASEEWQPLWFVQEVRRFYPFFPFVAARVSEDFEHRGYRFRRGTRTLLDLYGTNRDRRHWEEPHRFEPARFASWAGDPFTLIPQGAGDRLQNHRCPGEDITIVLMQEALRLLTTAMRYDVPPQDLRVSLSRVPTAPNSGFVLSNVRAT